MGKSQKQAGNRGTGTLYSYICQINGLTKSCRKGHFFEKEIIRNLIGLIGISLFIIIFLAGCGSDNKSAIINQQQQEGAVMSDNISNLANYRDYKFCRQSTTDPENGNKDYWFIEAGETRTIFDVSGCGTISHIWMTTPSEICSRTWFKGSLETTEIRMYWDGDTLPAVTAPLGAFFCAPFDVSREFVSTPIILAPYDGRGFNMYFPMPFKSSAKIELVNHSAENKFRIYFHINYVLFEDTAAVRNQGRFHALYHKEDPLQEGVPYTLFETQGKGHYVGTVLFFDTGIRKDRAGYVEEVKKRFTDLEDAWWWEGDEQIFVDGELIASGTGTEDYFGSSWSYAAEEPFTTPEFGCVMNGYNPRDYGRWCLYRWHMSYPVTFRESIRITLEHGHNNQFTMVPYHNVAYWYQF